MAAELRCSVCPASDRSAACKSPSVSDGRGEMCESAVIWDTLCVEEYETSADCVAVSSAEPRTVSDEGAVSGATKTSAASEAYNAESSHKSDSVGT